MATLINNKADLKANISALDANFTWESIKSFIEDIERDVLGDAIGYEIIAWFIDHLEGLDPLKAQVLQLLQRSEAYLGIYRWSQTALFRMTDKALYIAKATDGAIISDKKLRDLRNYCQEEGFNFLDKAITLMEKNLESFPQYAGSAARLELQKGFITTAADFNLQRSIDNSRLSFLSMYAIMLDEQDALLPRYMGADYYEVYKERFLDGDLSADEQRLLPLIKKAVAFATIARACKELPVKVTARGLFINKFNDAKEYDQQDPAEAARLDYLSDDTFEKCERKLIELQNKLIANPELYPGYVAPPADGTILNCADDGIIIL